MVGLPIYRPPPFILLNLEWDNQTIHVWCINRRRNSWNGFHESLANGHLLMFMKNASSSSSLGKRISGSTTIQRDSYISAYTL